ncbi:MAG: ATP-binding cassette domain-containing protein [Rikenellaceae bacterium]
MISVDNITLSFGGWDLFRDISFLINDKDRVALVGKNGAGKSTIMKIIAGVQNASSGQVSKSGDTTIGYLPQQMKLHDTRTVMDEALTAFDYVISMEKRVEELNSELSERTDYESKEYEKLLHDIHDATEQLQYSGANERFALTEKALLGLGFERSDFNRPSVEFSGGWRMRIELAKILLRRPSVMLLDEPTNHLDIESINWLEEYLSNYNGALLLISHDRKFLDTVTNRTIEIILGKIHDYRAPYSKYVELRKERLEQQKAAYENQQKLIQSTEEFIERFRYKPSKSNQVQSRVKQLEKLDIIEIDDEDLSALNIKFPAAPHCGQIVLEVKDAGKSYGDKHIFSGASFVLSKGEKIALLGRNGEGKSTFAKMVIHETETTRGEIKVGHNVKIGYFAQNQDDLMDGDFTVFDTLDRVAVGDIRTRLRDILGAFLFRGEDVDKKVKVLSGGERSRLAMARLMLEPYNLLILDEPTNHMDMRSKDILKSAIASYDGTVVVISHDREFLEGLTERIYEFSHGEVKEHLCGVYEFLEKKRLTSIDEINLKSQAKNSVQTAEKEAKQSEGKLSYEQKKERDKRLRKIKNEIESCEKNIEILEEKIADFDIKLANHTEYNIDLSDSKVFESYNALKDELEKMIELWSEKEEEYEEEKNKF